MGIQPIDLQTLYAQLDKVGKTQGAQQHAAQAAQDSQQAANRLKAEQRATTVQETEAGSEQAGKIRDRDEPAEDRGDPSKRHKDEHAQTDDPSVPEPEIIRDPALGNRIDLSG